MTPSSRAESSAAVSVALSSGTGSIRSRFSAWARTLRTIWSVVLIHLMHRTVISFV